VSSLETPDFGSRRPPTRTEWADDQLRSAIFRGEYAPGERLVISALAERFGVSATPLREALRRLSSEGLVELRSHGSAHVASVDLNEANEIYELRRVLEPMALERSVSRGDDRYRERVVRAWEQMDRHQIAPASDHAAFHRALLAACDSQWLLRLATMLSDKAGLMLAISLPGRPPDYNTARAHRRLRDLAIDGHAAASAAELSRHLDGTIAALRTVLIEKGEVAEQ
jgi:DNA-binding GntR family transcriptional regulator